MITPPRLVVPLVFIFVLLALAMLPTAPTVKAPAPLPETRSEPQDDPGPANQSPPGTPNPGAPKPGAPQPATPEAGKPRPAFDAGRVRGIYLTGYTAGNSRRLAELIEFSRTYGLNAMVIDAKNDDGLITFATDIPLAREIRSVSNQIPDVTGLIKTLAGEGIYPIARVVVFCDPLLSSRRPDLAIRVGEAVWRDGRRLSWTNPHAREVWEYNVEIAKAAARAGFREIQFDYVRFPEKNIPGVTEGVSQEERVAAISGFLRYALDELKPLGVAVSADVFGLTTTVSDDMRIGQDYATVAGLVDYISPMIYPSHYRAGNYGLANPEASPYETVLGSMQKAREKVPHLAPDRHRPWIQDFSLKHRYGKDQIEAQIRALAAAGIPQFLLWNPDNVYTPGVDYALIEEAARHAWAPAPALAPNERGRVMVLVYHQIGPREERWTRTPAGFRQDLNELYRRGYRPVNLGELVAGRIDLPAGTSPVVLTFDDATEGQFRYLDPTPGAEPAGGQAQIDADSAVGILVDFNRKHPDWPLKATFYVNGRPFGQPERWQEKVRFLVERGMEVGNHTLSHADLSKLDAGRTAAEIGGLDTHLHEAVPGLATSSLSLPFGAYPRSPDAARRGEHQSRPYEMKAFLLVGAGPAPSPHSPDFDPLRLPRIQAVDPAIEPRANLAYWLAHFDDHPEERYVSDGDPGRVTP